MKLYVQVHEKEIQQLSWASSGGEGWYEIDHEPEPEKEKLRYDPETDSVVIEQRIKTPEQIAAAQKAAEDAALFKPDTIRLLQGKIAELESRLTKVEEGKI